MPPRSVAAVRAQIDTGALDPIYLLQGEDEIEKSALAHAFEELVEEGLRPFNVERLNTSDLSSGERVAAAVRTLVAAARTFPMMVPRRLVIVRRAEALLTPRRESEASGRALDELERLIQAPEPQTTLVFVGSAIDKRSRAYKLLARHATIVECGVIEDQADAARWIRNRVAAAGLDIEPSAVRLLVERDGTDVVRLRNDVDRLLLYTLGQRSVRAEDVAQIAGPAVLQDEWALTNAMEAGDQAAALRQLGLMIEAGVVSEKILGQLGWLVRTKFTSGLSPAIEALFETDLALKRSAGEPRILLERLIVALCALRSPVAR